MELFTVTRVLRCCDRKFFLSFYRKKKKKNSQAEDDTDRMAARIIQVGGAGQVGGAEGRGAVPALRDALSFRLEGQRWWRCGACGRGLQRPVSRLVFGQNVLAAAELLPHVSYLAAQRRVLLLQEAGADGDLVLLKPPGVPRPLGRQVVLPAPRPVPVVL